MERFEADWLAARGPYDDAALDRGALASIRAWAADTPAERALTVVDLGSGAGAALRRAGGWLAPRRMAAYAVDLDAELLSRSPDGHLRPDDDGSNGVAGRITPVLADLLMPLHGVGGPPDGTVDLVLGHAIADLLPLDRLACRVAALLRPGGLAHLALTYDGVTAFDPPVGDDFEARLLSAYHRRMDRATATDPAHGGSTAGRRLAGALAAAGLELLQVAPSVWTISAGDGPGGRAVLDRLIRFVAEGAREVGSVDERDVERWRRARSEALVRRQLVARVTHRDVLARKPAPVLLAEPP